MPCGNMHQSVTDALVWLFPVRKWLFMTHFYVLIVIQYGTLRSQKQKAAQSWKLRHSNVDVIIRWFSFYCHLFIFFCFSNSKTLYSALTVWFVQPLINCVVTSEDRQTNRPTASTLLFYQYEAFFCRLTFVRVHVVLFSPLGKSCRKGYIFLYFLLSHFYNW